MTARLSRIFAFPLLGKELTEAAAQRRTYVVRVLYAVLLYGLFALMMPRWLWQSGTSPLQAMGAGRQLFEQLLLLQAAGIALFLPALMCGRIAQEKERDSLVLLLLTDLRPWQIILQKYLGGLAPMLSFLLLGMPLAAIAYAFGGVTTFKLIGSFYVLIVLCLQVGAISIFCSAWFRTTVGAFLATYFLSAVFYAGPPLLFYLLRWVWDILLLTGARMDWWRKYEYALLLIPMEGVENVVQTFVNTAAMPGRFPNSAALRLQVLWQLLPPLLSIPFFLGLARFFLVRRAFAPASNFLPRLFRFFDGVMKRSNHIVGNVMLIRETENLPGDAPIHWRETARRALGKVHYLVRILVAVEIPVVFLCGLMSGMGYGGDAEGLTVLAAFLAAMAAICLSAQAANTIVSERVRQTLEVLLTTPLSGRQIVLEKARALRRLAWVAAVPLLTVFSVECWMEAGNPGNEDGWLAYIVCAVSLVAIYLPMITWLSIWIGLRVRTRFRAIVTALVVLVLWCGLPIFLYIFELQWVSRGGLAATFESSAVLSWRLIPFLSPATAGVFNEVGELSSFPWEIDNPWPAIVFTVLLYGTITLLIRRHALAHADRWLRSKG